MKAYRCYVVFIDGLSGFAGALYEKRERAQREVDDAYAKHPEYRSVARKQEEAIRAQLGEDGYRRRLEGMSPRDRLALTGSGTALWEVREEEVPRDLALSDGKICRLCNVILGDDEEYTDIEAARAKMTRRRP